MFVCACAVKDLSVLHDRHLHRPTLDDSSEEERAIEMLTDEITQVCDKRTAIDRHWELVVRDRAAVMYRNGWCCPSVVLLLMI